MARYSAGMPAAGAGTTLRPILGILSTAAITPVIREVHLWNTTAVACEYRLVNLTGGTPGASIAEHKFRTNAPPALCLVDGLWTADATIDEDTGFSLVLGAQIGAAGILTFGDSGLEGVLGATKALGLVPVGTGQVCRVGLVWDE